MAVSAAPVRLRLNLERVQESLFFFFFFMLRKVNEKVKENSRLDPLSLPCFMLCFEQILCMSFPLKQQPTEALMSLPIN